MSDAELEQLHRRTELASWLLIIPALVLGWLGLVRDWPDWAMWVFVAPLVVAGWAARLSLSPMRRRMDRRGIDWDHP